MKILIIKNDGFGDFLLSIPLINTISKKYYIDVIINEKNKIFQFLVPNIKKFYIQKKNSNEQLYNSINKKKYNMSIVLRRSLDEETLEIMAAITAEKKYVCVENYSKKKKIRLELLNKINSWKNITINHKFIHEQSRFYVFCKNLNW